MRNHEDFDPIYLMIFTVEGQRDEPLHRREGRSELLYDQYGVGVGPLALQRHVQHQI